MVVEVAVELEHLVELVLRKMVKTDNTLLVVVEVETMVANLTQVVRVVTWDKMATVQKVATVEVVEPHTSDHHLQRVGNPFLSERQFPSCAQRVAKTACRLFGKQVFPK